MQASVLTICTPLDGGSLHMNGHEMNLPANMAQKRSVLNATPANEIGMAGELRLGDWRWSEPPLLPLRTTSEHCFPNRLTPSAVPSPGALAGTSR